MTEGTHPLFPPAGRGRALAGLLVGLAFFAPVFWMVLTAFKSRQDTLAVPPKLVFEPTLEHFETLWTGVNATGERVFVSGFGRNIANSIGICGISVLLALILGTLAAYGFARLRIAGTERWMFWILAVRMMPPLVIIVPLYVLFSKIGLGGSYIGIIGVYTAFSLPFVIWMVRGFLDELPKATEDAALLDGTSRLRILWRVCLPQIGPGLVATTVLALVFTWNDFLFSQMLTGQDTRTIPIAMLRVMGADFGNDWGIFAASGTVYLAPIFVVAFVLQKHLLRGVTFGTLRR